MDHLCTQNNEFLGSSWIPDFHDLINKDHSITVARSQGVLHINVYNILMCTPEN